jgi:hypothetical protein
MLNYRTKGQRNQYGGIHMTSLIGIDEAAESMDMKNGSDALPFL